MLNIDISETIKEKGLIDVEIVADSAEPKSIAELRRCRHLIEGALKGADRLNIGIGTLNKYKINVTKDSLNIIKELRNYKWQQDPDGKCTNKPIDKFNHTIDAIRYVSLNKLITISPNQMDLVTLLIYTHTIMDLYN